MIQLLVRFETGRDSDVVGRIVAVVSGDFATDKIAFIERGHRGVSPKPGETWVCAFVCDTQPGARKGAVIVRPLRQPTWGWQEVGEPLWGVRRREPVCEFPNVGSHLSPFSYTEREKANVAYRAAEEKQRLWEQHALTSEPFVAAFGRPTTFEPREGGRFEAVFAHGGRKTVDFWQVEESVGFSLTGAWRRSEGAFQVEAVLNGHPTPTYWKWLGGRGATASVSALLSQLPVSAQEEVLTALRQTVPSPEAEVEARWTTGPASPSWHNAKSIETLRAHLRALLGPSEGYSVFSKHVQGGDVLSDDERGYRSTSWTEHSFVVRGRVVDTGRWCQRRLEIEGGHLSLHGDEIPQTENPSSEELLALRDRLVARTRQELLEIFNRAGEFKDSQPVDPRIHPDREGWIARFRAEWNRRVAAQLAAWESEDAQAIEAAIVGEKARSALCIEVAAVQKTASSVQARLSAHRVASSEGEYSWTEVTNLETLDHLRAESERMQRWIESAEIALATELRARGEREIAARASKEETVRLVAEAMSAPATPAPWFIGGNVDIAALEKSTGRKSGEGLGERLTGGGGRYLPGDRSLVALDVGGGSVNRYSFTIKSEGLTSLGGGDLPTSAGGRHSVSLRAVPIHADWFVLVTDLEHGEVGRYSIYTAEGIGQISLYGSEIEYRCFAWGAKWDSQEQGTGPSEDLCRTIIGLAPRARPVVNVAAAKPATPPVPSKPADAQSVAASLDGLKGRFNKKR